LIEVRQASADDLDAVRQLLHDTWHATYDATMSVDVVNDITSRWHSMESLTRQLIDPEGCFLAAEIRPGTLAVTRAQTGFIGNTGSLLSASRCNAAVIQ